MPQLDGCHEDRSPQPSLVDRDRLASLRNDLLKRGTFNNRISRARPPPDDAPILQARVSIPASAPDRGQWLKQQSTSRRRRRRSSKSPAPQEGRGRRSSARFSSEHRSSSRDSSLGGGESDASSADSHLSMASTPETSGRQRQLERLKPQRRFGSSERTGPAGGPRADLGRRSSHGGSPGSRGLSPSMLSSALLGRTGTGTGGGSLSRNSSSSSLSTTVSSSSLGSLSLRWCGVCEAEFTRLRRPHRCRRCLETVCAPCSPARLPVPGSGSLELKRTCKRCAGRSSRPQVDVVVSPRRPAAAAGSSGTQRRAASVGSMIRAPLGVFSGVAAAVKYTTSGLYPAAAAAAAAAASGAVNGAEDAGKGKSRGLGDGAGGGSESGEAARRSSNDQAYLPTRIATGGLAALGRLRAGIGLSVQNPSEEPGPSAPAAAGAGEAAVDTPTLGGQGEAKANVVGADVAVKPDSEVAEKLSAASTPAVVAKVAEAKAPASDDQADVRVARPGVAKPSPRVREEPSTASTPAVGAGVAEAKVPEVEMEAVDSFQGVAGESPRASTPAARAEAAEAKVPQLESEAEVGAARADAVDPSAAVWEHLSAQADTEDAWTIVEGDLASEERVEAAVDHAEGGTRFGPAVTGGSVAVVSGGNTSWGGAREAVGSRGAAKTVAAMEEKIEDPADASGVAAAEHKTSTRPATAPAATTPERTVSEVVMDETVTSSPERIVPSSPLRRALRYVRRIVQPHVARLRSRLDSPPQRGGESLADLVPVLKAGSPIALECCAAFGIDAAAWMQTAHFASESYRIVEEQAKKRLARRRARR